jgi:hypothetical protein
VRTGVARLAHETYKLDGERAVQMYSPFALTPWNAALASVVSALALALLLSEQAVALNKG